MQSPNRFNSVTVSLLLVSFMTCNAVPTCFGVGVPATAWLRSWATFRTCSCFFGLISTRPSSPTSGDASVTRLRKMKRVFRRRKNLCRERWSPLSSVRVRWGNKITLSYWQMPRNATCVMDMTKLDYSETSTGIRLRSAQSVVAVDWERLLGLKVICI